MSSFKAVRVKPLRLVKYDSITGEVLFDNVDIHKPVNGREIYTGASITMSDQKASGSENPFEKLQNAYWKLVWSEEDKAQKVVQFHGEAPPRGNTTLGEGGNSVSNQNTVEYYQYNDEDILFDNRFTNGGNVAMEIPDPIIQMGGPTIVKGKEKRSKKSAKSPINLSNDDICLTRASGRLPHDKDPFVTLLATGNAVTARNKIHRCCVYCEHWAVWKNFWLMVTIIIVVIILYIIIALVVIKTMGL